jgi:hypothetical protein
MPGRDRPERASESLKVGGQVRQEPATRSRGAGDFAQVWLRFPMAPSNAGRVVSVTSPDFKKWLTAVLSLSSIASLRYDQQMAGRPAGRTLTAKSGGNWNRNVFTKSQPLDLPRGRATAGQSTLRPQTASPRHPIRSALGAHRLHRRVANSFSAGRYGSYESGRVRIPVMLMQVWGSFGLRIR